MCSIAFSIHIACASCLIHPLSDLALMCMRDLSLRPIATDPAAPLPARYFHVSVYDDETCRLLVFGGKMSITEQRRVNDVYSLRLGMHLLVHGERRGERQCVNVVEDICEFVWLNRGS